jgi:hypothetical protein
MWIIPELPYKSILVNPHSLEKKQRRCVHTLSGFKTLTVGLWMYMRRPLHVYARLTFVSDVVVTRRWGATGRFFTTFLAFRRGCCALSAGTCFRHYRTFEGEAVAIVPLVPSPVKAALNLAVSSYPDWMKASCTLSCKACFLRSLSSLYAVGSPTAWFFWEIEVVAHGEVCLECAAIVYVLKEMITSDGRWGGVVVLYTGLWESGRKPQCHVYFGDWPVFFFFSRFFFCF